MEFELSKETAYMGWLQMLHSEEELQNFQSI